MQWLLDVGFIVEIALGVILIEAIALLYLALRRKPTQTRPPHDLFANLASGALLLLALYYAVTGGSVAAIIWMLSMSGIAHASGVLLRMRATRAASTPRSRD